MYENYSVLFVDDEINILNSLRRSLSDEEYTCHFAESAIRACDLLESKKIHVIITDMRMPEMNGLELLKHVQANYPLVIKLVLSGYTQLPQVLATINQVDIFNFITKPWSIEELIVIIHKALDYYILQEENAKYKSLLEIKNQSYQNILKRIDDVIDSTKKTMELMRICGNEILSFGKQFSLVERDKYFCIFSKQYEIYDTISNAVTIERKAFGSNQILNQISEHILRLCPKATIDRRPLKENTIFMNKQMLEAILTSVIILFQDTFTQNGLYVNFGYSNRFFISLISPITLDENVKGSNGATIINTKMAFIQSLVDRIFDYCQISLQIINKDSNLVIGFSFEEQ